MKKLNVWLLVVASSFLFLGGCYPERQTGIFREPSKQDIDKAVSLYVQISYQHLKNKNHVQAMASVQQALKLKPDSPEAITALAVVYQAQGDSENARASYKKALRSDSGYSTARLNYGQFLFQQKEYEDACDEFEKASNDHTYELRSSAFFNLGVCKKAIGDTEGAEATLVRCLGIDPENSDALYELAELKFSKKAYSEAKNLMDKHFQKVRASNKLLDAKAIWLGIRLDQIFEDKDSEASLVLLLKNGFPYSKEYLEYKKSLIPPTKQ